MTRRRKGAVRSRTSKRSARKRRPSTSARAELEAMTHLQLMARWNELAVAGMKAGIKGVAQHASTFLGGRTRRQHIVDQYHALAPDVDCVERARHQRVPAVSRSRSSTNAARSAKRHA